MDVDRNQILDTLTQLAPIPSPTGYTEELAKFIEAELARAGIQAERSRRGAVHAVVAGRQSDSARAIVVHLDTLGAMVAEHRSDGRIGLAPIGAWPARFAENARVSLCTATGMRRGTIVHERASGHIWGSEVDNQPSGWDRVALRLDGDPEEAQIGDIVLFDADLEVTETGYIVGRHLDDKAGLACVLEAARLIATDAAPPPTDVHLWFTACEEVGTGLAGGLSPDVEELVGVDIAPAGPGQNTDERAVTIPWMDAAGPFDRALTQRLLSLAAAHDVEVRADIFRHYRSDVDAAVLAGADVRTALTCFGADGSHGVERVHLDALLGLTRLLVAYATCGMGQR